MRLEDLLSASDDEIHAEFRRQASTTVMSVSSLHQELQRRATVKLVDATGEVGAHAAQLRAASTLLTTITGQLLRSSLRIEKLTKYLLVLTILLLLAAVPLACDTFIHWFATPRGASDAVHK